MSITVLFHFLVVILGLCVFEIITSVDNAVINAHVLKTLPSKYRRIFLVWGILIAVFVIRGVLPFLIVWMANPKLSFVQVITFAFSSSPDIQKYVELSKPILLLGGGIYLVFVCLGWLFMEEKKYAFLVEHFIHKQSVWFYAIISVLFTGILFLAVKKSPFLAMSASVGATVFFITDGFKKNAEAKEQQLINLNMSAWSKIIYLEVLDASFSIDGVIGAFAFTISVPLILLGNGIGAFVVRELTIKGIDIIAKYAYLKNGAMYSIGFLGVIMILESFGQHYPFWLAPANTFLLLFVFLYLSHKEIKRAEEKKPSEKS